jgi:hypothetical protein
MEKEKGRRGRRRIAGEKRGDAARQGGPGPFAWSALVAQAQADTDRVIASLQEAGYAVVPTMPTEPMADAGYAAWDKQFLDRNWGIEDVWRAMLAAGALPARREAGRTPLAPAARPNRSAAIAELEARIEEVRRKHAEAASQLHIVRGQIRTTLDEVEKRVMALNALGV